MEVVFLNYLINVLISLFLVSFVNGLPQDNRHYRANVRFPSGYSIISSEDYGIYDSDFSGDEKRVRSPTASGWPAESQHISQETQIPVRSNSRSDDVRPQKVKGSQIMSDDGKIYFPDQVGKVQKNKTLNFVPVLPNGRPPCANGKSFCESTDYYPRSYLKDVLQKDEMMFHAYFGKDVIPPSGSNETNIQNRIDASFIERPLCQVRERVIFPKMAENSEGEWLFIANVDNYIQGVRVEECVDSPGTPCNEMASFPLGYSATCEQKYMYRKLIALNSSGKAIPDSFRLPACCTCKVIFHAGLGGRSAPESKPEPLPLTIPPTSTAKTAVLRAKVPRGHSNRTTTNR